jgi:hypothetical protein
MRILRLFSVVLAILMLSLLSAVAAGPSTVSYQGRLATSSDSPVADGPYSATFSLWTGSSGGSQVWTESQTIQCAKGLFSCELGSLNSFGELFTQYADQPLWLEVQVSISGIPQTMTPRTPVQSTPYAYGARRLVDDTITTGGSVIVAGDGIPQHIKLTADASGLRLGAQNGGVERAGFGVDLVSGTAQARVGEYVGGTSTLAREAKMEANDSAAGIAIDEGGVHIAFLGTLNSPPEPTTELHLRQYDPTKTYVAGDCVIYSNAIYSGSSVSRDLNGDGTADVSLSSRTDNTRSELKGHFETGDVPTQNDFGDVLDSYGFSSSATTDADGDGTAEFSRWEKVDNTQSLTQSLVDVDDDGTPDGGIEYYAKVPRTVLKQYFEHGDKPTQSRIVDSTDENGAGSEMASSNGGALYAVSSSTGASSSKLHVSRALADSFGALDLAEQVSLQASPDTAMLSVSSDAGGSNRDGWSMGHLHDQAILECSMLNGLPPGEPEVGSARIFVQKGSGMIGLGTLTPEARLVLEATPDSVTQTADVGDGSSSSSYNLRTRINQLEQILKAQGILATSRSITTCTDTGSSSTLEMSSSTTGSTAVVDASTSTNSSALDVGIRWSGTDFEGLSARSGNSGTSLSLTQGAASSSTGVSMDVTSSSARMVMRDELGDTTIVIDAMGRIGINELLPDAPLHHSSGARLTAGGVWTNASDENLKENFKPVDGEALLEKIEELPISQWNYKVESDEVTHIGPTAQDFKAAFGVGANDKTISTIDPSGIALAAIKQLSKENDELKVQVAELKKMVEALAKKK